jgi:hypothetical protein
LIITRGVLPIPDDSNFFPDEVLSNQVVPHLCTWQVRGEDSKRIIRQWWPRFILNGDDTYHTYVTLPEEELKHSFLEVYFEDIDGDGKREDWDFILDMRNWDWENGFEFKR